MPKKSIDTESRWNKIKNIPKNWWKNLENNIENAPPAMRDLMVAYAPLVRIERDSEGHKIKVPVGSYVPELKILANAGMLTAQIEEKNWAGNKKKSYAQLQAARPDLAQALYWDNGTRKTPFELSMVPSFNKGPVQKALEREYKYLRDNGLPLPVLVSKYRVGPDYLRDIGKAGLALKGAPVGFRINIKNPAHTLTLREKTLHYTANWAAWLLTIAGAVAIGVSNPLLFVAGAGALYLANKTGKDFGLYDVAETLHRDYGWMSTSALRKGKFSLAKSAETLLYISALAVAGFIAINAAWAGMLALPCWAWLAANGLAPAVATTLQYATAGFFGAVAGASTYAAVTFPIRYFWGLTFYDNQEHPSKKEVKRLPAINVGKGLPDVLDRKRQEVLAKISKPKCEISPDNQRRLAVSITTAFDYITNQANVIATEAANDTHKNKKRHRNK